MSDFGTGKTSLLKAKAKILLAQKQKIVIIIFDDKEANKESILTTQWKIEFGKDVVHNLKGSGKFLKK